MAVIRDFRWIVRTFLHPRRGWRIAALLKEPRAIALSRGYSKHPHHQSKKDKSSDQGEQGVERMKVEVGIPRQTMLS
jgi:hypothetical protein